jgi:hypothetical protein
MSADDGVIIRRNKNDKFVGMVYFASADEYPDVNDERYVEYPTLESCIEAWNDRANEAEYGLKIDMSPYSTPRETCCTQCGDPIRPRREGYGYWSQDAHVAGGIKLEEWDIICAYDFIRMMVGAKPHPTNEKVFKKKDTSFLMLGV